MSVNTTAGMGTEQSLHPHWRQFPPLPAGFHVTVAVVMTVVGLLAVGGNTLTIVLYARFRTLRCPGNMLIVNLALSDLLVVTTTFPIYIAASCYGYWPFSMKVCEMYGFFGGIFGFLSISTLAAIAVDRYHASRNAKLGLVVNKRGGTMYLVVLLLWVYSACLAAPPLWGWNSYTLEGSGTTCTFDYLTRTTSIRVQFLTMYFCGFIIPLLITSYCYINILIDLIKYRREMKYQVRGCNGVQNQRTRTVLRTALCAFLCVILFSVSWSPYAIVAWMGEFGDLDKVTPLVASLCVILAKASTFYNPVVYALLHPHFKLKLKSILKGMGYTPCVLSRRRLAGGHSHGHHVHNKHCIVQTPDTATYDKPERMALS